MNGYEVFDSYVEDVERQRIAKEKAAAATAKKPAAKDEKDEHEEGETKEVAKEAVSDPSICFEVSLSFMAIVARLIFKCGDWQHSGRGAFGSDEQIAQDR